MGKSKIGADEKLSTVHNILEGNESVAHASQRLGINKTSVKDWVLSYQNCGEEALRSSAVIPFPKEVITQAVAAYLNGEGSLYDVCRKFKIRSKTQLIRWIKQYNDSKKQKASGTGDTTTMNKKARQTTYEERLEIATYCIEHEHNYSEAAEKFNVSYQQARSYTVKVETGGKEALQDKRGKRKSEDTMSELEKLRAELKLETAQRKKAEMELDFLKNLKELERRWN